MSSTRQAIATATATAPTAKYLQARISHLSLQLLKRYNALLSAASDSSASSDEPLDTTAESSDTQVHGQPPPSPIETVSAQIDIEFESQAIIKAAEEIMVMTRGLKELWLFGGLNTVDGEEAREKKRREQRELREEVEHVRLELAEWLMARLKDERKGDGEVAEVAG